MLCFALDLADQERTGFRYHYSLFQAEYSRNLLFTSGRRMDRVLGALIDRVRGPLDLRTVKTLFGRRQRPRRHKGQPRAPVVEVSLETPEYDLTILRIRFRRLVLKIYTKGERVLRIEAMAHNARDLGCRLGASYFPEAVAALRRMVDRFIEVLDCLDTTFIDAGLLDRLPRPGRLGAVRVGGIDINADTTWMPKLYARWPLCSCSATRSSVHALPRAHAPYQQRPGPTLRQCSSRDANPLRHRWDRRLSRILNFFTIVSPQAA